jgi:phytoene dehydrogenase-like protein
MTKSIAVIGAGIAGLSAGCYARMNGFDTIIFELHDKPGGLCTSWERDGYVIDGCIHWLCGSSARNNFHAYWRELGALQGVPVIDHDEFFRMEGPEGKQLIFYTDVDRLEKHLIELAPADRRTIEAFTRRIRLFARMDARLAQQAGSAADRVTSALSMARFLYHLFRSGRVSVQQFASRFKDPFLQQMFGRAFNLPDFPLFALLYTLGMMHNRAAGYPLGGSLEFARRIERRYLALGGQIRYNSRVRKILVEDGKAAGVQLEDGSEVRTDFVISAADGHSTLFEMLGERYLDDKVRRYYRELKPFPPLVYIAVGVDQDLSGEPHSVTCQADPPLRIPGNPGDLVSLRHFCYDPGLAPAGKSVLVSMFSSDYSFWKEIGADPCRYENEKRSIEEEFLKFLERRFPGIGNRVEMIDVATPLTFERYTGNWQGSFEGWLITTKSILVRIRKTLPAVAGFHMIGQWVQPGGGLPPAAMHGREVIQKLCRACGQKFRTSEPQART